MIRVARLAVAVLALGLLAGCSLGSGYSDLDREATDADVLPAELPGYASEDFEDDTVRFVGEHDGSRYFLARATAPWPGACVVRFRSAEDWVGGCGGRGGPLTLTSGGTSVVLAPDGHPDLEQGTPVGANLVVVD